MRCECLMPPSPAAREAKSAWRSCLWASRFEILAQGSTLAGDSATEAPARSPLFNQMLTSVPWPRLLTGLRGACFCSLPSANKQPAAQSSSPWIIGRDRGQTSSSTRGSGGPGRSDALPILLHWARGKKRRKWIGALNGPPAPPSLLSSAAVVVSPRLAWCSSSSRCPKRLGLPVCCIAIPSSLHFNLISHIHTFPLHHPFSQSPCRPRLVLFPLVSPVNSGTDSHVRIQLISPFL
jgi:hypothetical protein